MSDERNSDQKSTLCFLLQFKGLNWQDPFLSSSHSIKLWKFPFVLVSYHEITRLSFVVSSKLLHVVKNQPSLQTIIKIDFILNVHNTKQKIFRHVSPFQAQFPIVVMIEVCFKQSNVGRGF